jgi:hypothetical protein
MRWSEQHLLESPRLTPYNLARPRALLSTASRLFALLGDLERRKLAHGDLQHGNIMIAESGVELVDYDGMFVPAFAGTAATEGGVPSYQHPNRSAVDSRSWISETCSARRARFRSRGSPVAPA